MAGDKGSRRFVRDWWLLAAFMLGAALGALASNAIGVYLTLWVVIGVGVPLLAVSVMFAHFEDRRRMTTAQPSRRTPRKTAATATSVPSSKVSLKGKPTGTRGQLRAINGKKTTPSTGSSGSGS
jgi:hypothetical protein